MLLLEDKLTKVIDALVDLIPDDFGVYEDSGESYQLDTLYWEIRNKTGIEVYVDCGISKAVVIIPGCSKVVKIPFGGFWYVEEEYNEETDEYEYGEDYFVNFFDYGLDEDDFCAIEVMKYEEAEIDGFEQYLAEEYMHSISKSGTKIYVQERVIPINELWGDEKVEPTQNSKDYLKEHNYIGTLNWSALFIDTYGLDAFNAFVKYANEACLDSDLHSGNLAITYDRKPIIHDYSGWA